MLRDGPSRVDVTAWACLKLPTRSLSLQRASACDESYRDKTLLGRPQRRRLPGLTLCGKRHRPLDGFWATLDEWPITTMIKMGRTCRGLFPQLSWCWGNLRCFVPQVRACLASGHRRWVLPNAATWQDGGHQCQSGSFDISRC
jgi:hypothetical protein